MLWYLARKMANAIYLGMGRLIYCVLLLCKHLCVSEYNDFSHKQIPKTVFLLSTHLDTTFKFYCSEYPYD